MIASASLLSFMVAAQSAAASSSLTWIVGIAAFIGFIFGSVPTSGANRGWEFDMPGAVLWAVAAGLVAFGLHAGFATSDWVSALVFGGFGALLGFGRILATLPPRSPRNTLLNEGVNRVEGETPKAKFKAAKKLFYNASFKRGDYYATRGLKEFWYGFAGGMPAYDLQSLASGIAYSSPDTFDILVLLVNRLPDQENEPAVIVVRGGSLRSVGVGSDYLEIPGVGKVQTAWVAGMVGYAWR